MYFFEFLLNEVKFELQVSQILGKKYLKNDIHVTQPFENIHSKRKGSSNILFRRHEHERVAKRL
jgi:hypothetical protein